MNTRHSSQYNKGIVQFIIIIILTVIILSLLGVSLSSLFNEKTLRENFTFLWKGVLYVWDTYLYPYGLMAWNTIKHAVGK